jgi:hypothetical protein
VSSFPANASRPVPVRLASGSANDLGVLLASGDTFLVFQNTGALDGTNPTFTPAFASSAPGAGAVATVAGDFNQDGRTEYVTLNAMAGAPLTTRYNVTGTATVTGLGSAPQAGGYNLGVHLPGSSGGQIQGTVYVPDASGNFPFYEGVTVYVDLNHNGKLDPGEPNTTPSINGVYHFGDLPPDGYQVRLFLAAGGKQVLPAGNDPMVPDTAAPVSVTIDHAGQVVYGADFAVDPNQNSQALDAALVLRDPKTQQVYLQTRDGAGRIQASLLGRLDGASWRVAGAGHWDGNVLRDLLLYNPETGQLKVWQLSAGNQPHVRARADLGFTLPAGWDVAALADHDQNGTTDLYLQSERTGEVAVWLLHGRELLGHQALPLGDVPGDLEGVADLDGDGAADLLWEDGNALWATRQGVKTEVGRLPAGWVVADVLDRPGAPAEVLLQDAHSGALQVWTLDGQARKAAEQPLDYGAHDGTLMVQRARRTPAAGSEDPDAACVRQLYSDVLQRAADAVGLDAWVAQIRGGVTRQQLAEDFWASAEHRGLEVDHFYATYLHRAPDASGRALWVSALLGGMSEEQVAGGFLASDEYRLDHADTAAYLTGLYADVLGRAPEPVGLDRWQQAVEGGLSRAAVADAFLRSAEADRQAVDRYYADYLGRAGSAAEVAGWVGALQGGLTPEQVAVVFLASDEFYNRAAR